MSPRAIRRAAERKLRKEARKEALRTGTASQAASPLVETPGPDLSEARLAANRANAQLSTGPTSEEGKAKVSLNALKTGLTGRTVLLSTDEVTQYQATLSGFEKLYQPATNQERELVQSLCDTTWRLRRIPNLEAAILAKGCLEFADAFPELESDPAHRMALIQAEAYLKYERQLRNLHIQEARLQRHYEKDAAELRQLQQERRDRKEPQKTESTAVAPLGFEFSTPKSGSNAEPAHTADSAQVEPNEDQNYSQAA